MTYELLSQIEQRDLGVGEPAPIAYRDQVHHDELDALMHVNNVRYMVWFERARIRFMEHYGIGMLGASDDPRTVIRSGEIHWIEEMLRDAPYVVTARCVAMRHTSFSLEQTIWSGARLRARFTCVMVVLDARENKKVPLSDAVRARLAADGARQN